MILLYKEIYKSEEKKLFLLFYLKNINCLILMNYEIVLKGF